MLLNGSGINNNNSINNNDVIEDDPNVSREAREALAYLTVCRYNNK